MEISDELAQDRLKAFGVLFQTQTDIPLTVVPSPAKDWPVSIVGTQMQVQIGHNDAVIIVTTTIPSLDVKRETCHINIRRHSERSGDRFILYHNGDNSRKTKSGTYGKDAPYSLVRELQSFYPTFRSTINHDFVMLGSYPSTGAITSSDFLLNLAPGMGMFALARLIFSISRASQSR